MGLSKGAVFPYALTSSLWAAEAQLQGEKWAEHWRRQAGESPGAMGEELALGLEVLPSFHLKVCCLITQYWHPRYPWRDLVTYQIHLPRPQILAGVHGRGVSQAWQSWGTQVMLTYNIAPDHWSIKVYPSHLSTVSLRAQTALQCFWFIWTRSMKEK